MHTGDEGALYPLRLFEAPLPKGEARACAEPANSSINRNLRHKDTPGEVDPRPGNRFACEAGLCGVGVDKENLTHSHKCVYSAVSVGI